MKASSRLSRALSLAFVGTCLSVACEPDAPAEPFVMEGVYRLRATDSYGADLPNPTQSERRLSLEADSSWVASSSICDSEDDGEITTGRLLPDRTIESESCDRRLRSYEFRRDTLVMFVLCIEGCRYYYVKER